jgi:hypothetical protein
MPAASPVAKHGGISFVAWCARWSTLMQRPATSRFAVCRGSRLRYGMWYSAPYFVQCPVVAIVSANTVLVSSRDSVCAPVSRRDSVTPSVSATSVR